MEKSFAKYRYLVYGLVDPKTNELRYVGQSRKGLKRPKEHWTSKKCLAAKDHCHNWVRTLLAESLIPEVIVLEELSSKEELNEAEKKWIAQKRAEGCDLTNMTAGGEGTHGLEPWCKGKNLSEEHRRKIGEGNRGKVIPQWMRDLASRTHKGKIESEETRRKKSESHKGLLFSEEHRKNLSKALKGKKMLPGTSRNCHLCQKEIVLSINDRRMKLSRVFCSLSCCGKIGGKWSKYD